MATVSVFNGDITKTPGNIITLINSEGMWFGGVDSAIMRAAGNMYHEQAAAVHPLHDGKTVVARKTAAHHGSFRDVVFVVDDLQQPLSNLVFIGLQAAEEAGLDTVNLPAMRTGVMLGVKEKTLDETAREMAKGIHQFIAIRQGTVRTINIVVYNDAAVAETLKKALGLR